MYCVKSARDELKQILAKYDPTSGNFISSDIDGENSKEGYYQASTILLGINNTDSEPIKSPNTEDGDIVYTYTMDGANWVKTTTVAAITSYKKSDGVTDMKLPEGIQERASSHRVRCIYNPTPSDDLISSVTRVVNEDQAYDYKVETSSRTPGSGWPSALSSEYKSINNVNDIPSQPE